MNKDDSEDIDIETTRKQLLKLIADMSKSLYDKFDKGRIRDPTKERIRINIANSFFKGCRAFNEILTNMEMEEIKEELERLKKMVDKGPK